MPLHDLKYFLIDGLSLTIKALRYHTTLLTAFRFDLTLCFFDYKALAILFNLFELILVLIFAIKDLFILTLVFLKFLPFLKFNLNFILKVTYSIKHFFF